MKVLVVDDHALIREALRGVLRELHADMQVLEAETSQQGMELIQQHPDLALILLDLRLPDRDGIDVLVELRELYPAISVVMLSAFNDRDNVFKALDCGALGFIPKTTPRRSPVRTAAHSGRRCLHSSCRSRPRAAGFRVAGQTFG